MLRIWDRHVTHRNTPALLSPLLRAAGFTVETVIPELCHDTTFRSDGLAMLMTHLIRAYAGQNRLATESEIEAWVAEQHRMAAEGSFFFAITHYVVVAIRNASLP
jgi:arsenite methyltransferase